MGKRPHKCSINDAVYDITLVAYRNLRFLITDKPTDPTLTQYIEELQRRKVTDVVRVCESTYSAKRLEQAGIKCHDWAFDDGIYDLIALILFN